MDTARGPEQHLTREDAIALGLTAYVVAHSSNNPRDVEQAVDCLEWLYAAGIHEEEIPSFLSVMLRRRGVGRGDRADLDRAVEIGVLAVRRAKRRDLASPSNSLGIALRTRFELYRNAKDLDRAIQVLRRGIRQSSSSDRDRPALWCSLANALMARFQLHHATKDLQHAIAAARTSVDCTAPEDSRLAPHVIALSNALRIRYALTKKVNDLADAANELGPLVQTLVGQPTHRFYPHVLTDYASILEELSDLAGGDERMERSAEEYLRFAVRALNQNDGGSFLLMLKLGNKLISRSARRPRRHHVQDALRLGERVLRRLAEDDARFPLAQSLVARALLLRDRTARRRGELGDRQRAKQLFRAAALSPFAHTKHRGSDAIEWAHLAAAAGDWRTAAQALELAVQLRVSGAAEHLPETDQQLRLRATPDLTAEAANAYIRAGMADHALAVLEYGRTVLHQRILEMRAGTEELRRHAPSFVDRFEDLQSVLRDRPPAGRWAPGAVLDEEDSSGHSVARQWNDLLDEIREIPELKLFLLPPAPEQMVAMTGGGPVVAVVASSFGGHAIIVDGTGIRSVELPRLSLEEVVKRADTLETAAPPSGGADNGFIRETLGWLWDVIAEPVLGELGWLEGAAPTDRRLWWMPIGHLTALPLHAAGYHEDERELTVFAHAISSYTPTLRALDESRRRIRGRTLDTTNALVVALHDNDRLANTKNEAARVAQLLGAHNPLINRRATRKAVRRRLPETSLCHFACHAVVDDDDPGSGHLQLRDGPLTVREVSAMTLTNGYLAYLSSCMTSYATAYHPDESLHVAGAFHIAGFPNVIGSLWRVDDGISLRVAESFYSLVRQGMHPATALHETLLPLREAYVLSPSLWAQLVHIGP